MKYSKNIYLDDDHQIDEEMKTMSQAELRSRLRTGHILHTILGDLLASSLHDFIRIDTQHQLEAMIDTIQHYDRMQKRMNKEVPEASSEVVEAKQAVTPPVISSEVRKEEDKGKVEKKKIPCKFKSIPGV